MLALPAPAPATILIIDDTPANVGVLAESLGVDGLAVIVAQDGEEGVTRAEFARPDLILLDVMLPGIDGLETCRRLKANPLTRDIPVIFMTALSDIGDKVAGLGAGGVDYVTKPFHTDEVRARVRTHLALCAMRRQLSEQNRQLQHEVGVRVEAEAALQRAHAELEARVAQRTAELALVNACLREENQVRRQAEERYRESQTLLRELAARSEAVREDERKYLTREIHDELGQYLSALRLGVSMVGLEFGARHAPLQAKVGKLVGLVDATIKVVRNIVASLRPAALDLGIVSALEWLADEFVGRTGIPCALAADEACADLDEECATALFRIVQESLTNISRHAGASRVEVTLRRDAAQLLLRVSDDGKGFDPAVREEKSFGLACIRERALMFGGKVEIASAPGAGTSIVVSLPLRQPGRQQ